MKCMAKSRDNRPQTVAEILKVIQNVEIDQRDSGAKKTSYSGQPTIVADIPKQEENYDRTSPFSR